MAGRLTLDQEGVGSTPTSPAMSKKPTLFRQVELIRGNEVLMGNVPDMPQLKVGAQITLKDDPDQSFWTISWMAMFPVEKKDLRTDWNNNI